MSTQAIADHLLAPVATGRRGASALEATREAGLVVVATSAFGPCTCPGECDRDHDNE